MSYTIEHWIKGGKYKEVRDYDEATKTHLQGNGWVRVTDRKDWSLFVEKKKAKK